MVLTQIQKEEIQDGINEFNNLIVESGFLKSAISIGKEINGLSLKEGFEKIITKEEKIIEIKSIKGRKAMNLHTWICYLPAIIDLKNKELIFFYKGLAIISLINNTTESSVSSLLSLWTETITYGRKINEDKMLEGWSRKDIREFASKIPLIYGLEIKFRKYF